jgi:hypothetical protein
MCLRPTFYFPWLAYNRDNQNTLLTKLMPMLISSLTWNLPHPHRFEVWSLKVCTYCILGLGRMFKSHKSHDHHFIVFHKLLSKCTSLIYVHHVFCLYKKICVHVLLEGCYGRAQTCKHPNIQNFKHIGILDQAWHLLSI